VPLSYTGASAQNQNGGTNYQAKGSKGEAVVVDVSRETLDDHGEWAAQNKASEKYDAGQFVGNVVTVHTTDF
jgi:hypothetical protein